MSNSNSRCLVKQLGGFVLCLTTAWQSLASEGGGSSWPLGVSTVLPAILPPLGGTQLYNYTVWYSADSYRNNRGDSSIPKFKANSYMEATRVVHTWGRTESGVNLSSGVIVSGGHVDVKMLGQRDQKTGLNSLFVTPLYLTWQPAPNVNLLTGFSAFIPIGDYNRKDSANTTRNYLTYTQEFALTWFINPSWEISLDPTVSFNARNHDTDYRSGNLFNVDYNFSYRFSSMPDLQLGVVGYYTQQFSNDELEGHDVAGGNRLRKFAIGPQLFYKFGEATGIAFKWMHETSVKNGPKGDALWFQFALPL
ncbi:SphA family protein [Azotobacter beijerinckii]|nr:transporter [Azotobacter beijerinckii]